MKVLAIALFCSILALCTVNFSEANEICQEACHTDCDDQAGKSATWTTYIACMETCPGKCSGKRSSEDVSPGLLFRRMMQQKRENRLW